MSRLSLAAFILAITACIAVTALFVMGSKRAEQMHRDQADLARRVSSTESVYDVQDCVLAVSDDGCDMGEAGLLSLAPPDRDGEVRSLIQKTKDGKALSVAPLTKEETYVRIKHTDGSAEGYVSDRKEGAVEIYLAKPVSLPERDERLPIMIRHVFATSTTP